MINMKKVFYITILLSVVFSCSEKNLEPINEKTGKPDKVTVMETTPIAGGVRITYEIPNSNDILGVKAIYTLQSGKQREVVSSYYKTSLEIKGYTDEKVHSATLYTFNRALEFSDPVEVSFTPLKSAIQKVVESFEFLSDFGGVGFRWKNEDKEILNFEFLGENDKGELQTVEIISSQLADGSGALRGYDTNPYRFGAIVSDRYENYSDTLYPKEGVITPLFEEQLDRSKIEILNNNTLPQAAALIYPFENDVRWDYPGWASGNSAYSMFDGSRDTWSHTYMATVPGAAFTIDLHCLMKLSRIHTFQRDYNYAPRVYNQGNIELFEVWGAQDQPIMNGKWEEAGWIKIGDFKTIKPSGSPLGTVTDEDFTVAAKGHDFTIDITSPAVRYIRVKVNRTFGNVSNCYFAEVSFFGEIID